MSLDYVNVWTSESDPYLVCLSHTWVPRARSVRVLLEIFKSFICQRNITESEDSGGLWTHGYHDIGDGHIFWSFDQSNESDCVGSTFLEPTSARKYENNLRPIVPPMTRFWWGHHQESQQVWPNLYVLGIYWKQRRILVIPVTWRNNRPTYHR